MTQIDTDLFLHPVRMRIIQHLSKGAATVHELKEWMADVPQATLYRHLNRLTKNKIIHIVDERKIRGAVEKTYAMQEDSPYMTVEELEQLSGEEHLKLFMTFLSSVTGQARSYLLNDPDLARDSFGYNQLDLYVTPDELKELTAGMNELLSKFKSNRPTDGNEKISLIQMLIPEPKGRDHT
ncbi:helix-turn-helix domain-containing protein [Rossellomorea vietnamensis]|uniref:Helix-turn-helix domain-containing protein n=1 Tax=Rossellomorea vietnamensis TaxID=218284 RepID=A0ACD4CDA5_9BACI|nr:helix-turn-helix domain-containing protein [Rossellomorea vietnamensis]UXH46493.1 helix-turn-helix domain-containing protein [Rossellomorea vietnamensis]